MLKKTEKNASEVSFKVDVRHTYYFSHIQRKLVYKRTNKKRDPDRKTSTGE